MCRIDEGKEDLSNRNGFQNSMETVESEVCKFVYSCIFQSYVEEKSQRRVTLCQSAVACDREGGAHDTVSQLSLEPVSCYTIFRKFLMVFFRDL